MKIGFYSSMPLEDKRNWSGTMFNMYQQMISLGYEVEWIPKMNLSYNQSKRLKTIEKIFNKIFNRGYSLNVNIYTSKCLGKKISKYLNNKNYDLLFVPTYLNDFAYVKTKIPIIYLNDANIGQLINYYPYFSGLGLLSKLETKYLELKMLKNVDKIIYSSDWASNYAINQYKIDPSKVHIIKFGANLIVPEFIDSNRSENDEYFFLFLAVDWNRKRGDLAFESLKILREKGYPIKMLIIGCNPKIDEDWVEIIPHLNKNISSEFKLIQEYLLGSHFLFVPTKADCTPIAFCEAAGYGLPVISTDTGGVSAHIENNFNGILLSPESKEDDYAKEIEKLLNNPDQIIEMSKNARKKYNEELNWNIWGIKMSEILRNIN